MKTLAASPALSTAKILPSLSAAALGLTIVLGLGFLQDANNHLHNAAHALAAETLQHHFVILTFIINALLWLTLGALSGSLLRNVTFS